MIPFIFLKDNPGSSVENGLIEHKLSNQLIEAVVVVQVRDDSGLTRMAHVETGEKWMSQDTLWRYCL